MPSTKEEDGDAGEDTAIDLLVDCLEKDLFVEQEKYQNTSHEVARLREHLLQVDKELTEEGRKRDQLVERFKERPAELQSEVQFWRQKYEEVMQIINEDEDDDGDTDRKDSDNVEDQIIIQIENATSELKRAQSAYEHEQQRAANLLSTLKERDRDIAELQEALQELEHEKRREIELGLAETRDQLEHYKKTVAALNGQLEDARAETVSIPDLKRKIAELDKEFVIARAIAAQASTDTVSKALVANLLANLFDRSRPVDRPQIAMILCDLVGMPEEDRDKILGSGDSNGGTSTQQAGTLLLSERWLSFFSRGDD
jgi:chromosome segregation ATPase